MPPEHIDLEADWLASELKRSGEYARKAYTTKDDAERQLFLANLIGTLDTLFTHYKAGPPPEYPEYNNEEGPLPTATHRGFEYKRGRGPIARFFLGPK